MPDEPAWHFGPFRLEPSDGRLWRGTEPLHLRPKSFAVLHYLLRHAGRLVSKDALLHAVWPDVVVSEAMLTICLGELRRALGETRRAPRFIETVARRGYRFMAPVTRAGHTGVPGGLAPAGLLPLSPPAPGLLVGREAALAQLQAWWGRAQQGMRQVVFVTGEAGIGKTTLVDAWCAQLAAAGPLRLGRGQCLDHHGAGEAYLPVLEALGQLCRGSEGAALVAQLAQYAPTWLLQMPALLSPADLEGLQQRVCGASPERMLRELAEAVEVLTAEQPLVLVVEDLHWSDAATLDLLAYLARRRAPARLLVLGTYRPAAVVAQGHPLSAIKQELSLHGLCQEVALEWLTEAEVGQYLGARFAGQRVPAALVRLLHRRTDGNPLFLTTMVDYLLRQGWLAAEGGQVTVPVGVETLAATVPDSLRQLIEQQLAQFSPAAQRVLEAASVAGVEWAVEAVAAGCDDEVLAVEEQCGVLARREQFVQPSGVVEWPDGTVTGRYRFRHALYQQVLYDRVPVGRRVHLHRRIGMREEAGYGAHAGERAAVLAMHFMRGRDAPRAVPYLRQAAENALERYAYQEAITHLTQAQAVLETLPASPERTAHEVAVHLTLGPALIVTRGQVAADVERTYARAWELCQYLEETPQLVPVLHGLMSFYVNQGALDRARVLAEQQLRIAQRQPDPALRLVAHTSLGINLYHAGDFVAARTHLEQGLVLAPQSPPQSAGLRHEVVDYGVLGLAHLARTLWKLGYPDQAGQRSQEALQRAQQLAHPHSLGLVRRWTAVFEQLRGDERAVHEHAEAAVTLAMTYEFPQVVALGTLMRGWALARQGQGPEGMAQMQQSLQALQALGVGLGRPYWLALLAEIADQPGQGATGRQWLAEALDTAHHTGERNHEAELYRLQGELLLSQEVPDRAGAAEALGQAIAVARRQQAKMLELRAATSLARLWQQQGQHAAARALLAPIYGWFTEGFDTADLQEASTLLQELGDITAGHSGRMHYNARADST